MEITDREALWGANIGQSTNKGQETANRTELSLSDKRRRQARPSVEPWGTTVEPLEKEIGVTRLQQD